MFPTLIDDDDTAVDTVGFVTPIEVITAAHHCCFIPVRVKQINVDEKNKEEKKK